MKTLILTRHAKSSWGDLSMLDHDRALNTRGQASATAIGRWLCETGRVPDQVISSSAKRCVQTWEGVLKTLPTTPEVSFLKRLYLASPLIMYEALKQASGDTVLMLGHNPGTADYAASLIGAARPTHPQFNLYPTAATTIIAFDISNWSDLSMGSGTAIDFIVPRELLE